MPAELADFMRVRKPKAVSFAKNQPAPLVRPLPLPIHYAFGARGTLMTRFAAVSIKPAAVAAAAPIFVAVAHRRERTIRKHARI